MGAKMIFLRLLLLLLLPKYSILNLELHCRASWNGWRVEQEEHGAVEGTGRLQSNLWLWTDE